jgi:hypothetical protein
MEAEKSRRQGGAKGFKNFTTDLILSSSIRELTLVTPIKLASSVRALVTIKLKKWQIGDRVALVTLASCSYAQATV